MRAVITPQFEAAVDTELPVTGRVSLESFDEFGPLGQQLYGAAPLTLAQDGELTELGRPLACPYTPAEYLL